MLQKIGKAKKKRKTKHLCSWGDIFLSSKNVVITQVMQGSSNRCCHDGNSPVVLLPCNAMAFPSYPVPVCRHRARTGNLSLALAHPLAQPGLLHSENCLCASQLSMPVTHTYRAAEASLVMVASVLYTECLPVGYLSNNCTCRRSGGCNHSHPGH